MSGASRTSRSPDALRDALALRLAPGVGDTTWHAHVARFGSAAQALDDAIPRALHPELRERAEAIVRGGDAAGLTALLPDDDRYPARLRDLSDAPPVLWAAGDLAVLAPPGVALVGTRGATSYGLRTARALAGAVASSGGGVVSGMAMGVDAAAHEAALGVNGATVAVLGTGADVPYPASHRRLYAAIRERGLVLSELPPGTKATPGSFPQRNRIIAALATVTVVVEAGVKSGALITAADAMELGRVVAAVPGPIDVPQSEGANLLIRDGAQILTGPADLLALAGLAHGSHEQPALIDPSEIAVWDALGQGASRVDALCHATGLPASTCFVALTNLELRGMVVATMNGELRRVAR